MQEKTEDPKLVTRNPSVNYWQPESAHRSPFFQRLPSSEIRGENDVTFALPCQPWHVTARLTLRQAPFVDAGEATPLLGKLSGLLGSWMHVINSCLSYFSHHGNDSKNNLENYVTLFAIILLLPWFFFFFLFKRTSRRIQHGLLSLEAI